VLVLLEILLFVVFAVVVLLYQGAAILFAAQMPRLDPEPPGPLRADWPSVSVIVAARNEEFDLPACLADLLAQDYPGPLEILVVDGASTDRTKEVATSFSPRVRLLEEPPLPAGWVGKSWGCDVGYRAAGGDLLLFTDADVRYHRSAVRAAVNWLRREGADVVTLAPTIETRSFWERVVMPFYVQMVLTYFRAPRTNRAGSRSAVINGQFWLVRREAYERVGGHAAVRSDVIEDLALAHRLRAAGARLRLGWSPGLLSTRMYRNRTEMAEGIGKTIQGLEYSAARQVGFLAGLIGLFWIPLALPLVGYLSGLWPLTVLGSVVAIGLFAKHVGFSRETGSPAAYGLLFPAAVGFYVVLVLRSLDRGRRGAPVEWKGRRYEVRPTTDASPPQRHAIPEPNLRR
jgi:chlorobactene glucosyltransferase